MSKKLKLGIVGLGVMGENHARIASSHPAIKLIGAAEPDPTRREEISKRYQVNCVADYHDLLPQVEALIVATPASTHFEIASDCLKARKYLLVEKPFTASSKRAQELVNLAQEHQVKIFTNFIERFNPAFQKLLQVIKSEKIHALTLNRFSPFPERISDTNVVFDMMIHDLDLLFQITRDEIISLRAKGKKAQSKSLDQVEATIIYHSGLIARVEASRIFGIKSRKISAVTDRFVYEGDLLNKRVYRRDFSSAFPSAYPVTPKDQLAQVLTQLTRACRGMPHLLPSGDEAVRAIALAEKVIAECS